MESQGNSPAHNWEKDPPELAGAGARSNLETSRGHAAPHPASDGITFTDDPFSGHGRGQVNGIHENAFRFCLGDQGVPERRGDSGETTLAAAERQAFFSHEEPGSAFSPKRETVREKGNLTGQDMGCWGAVALCPQPRHGRLRSVGLALTEPDFLCCVPTLGGPAAHFVPSSLSLCDRYYGMPITVPGPGLLDWWAGERPPFPPYPVPSPGL